MTLGTISVDAFSGSSPWDAPGNWDSITINGVVYGTNAANSSQLDTQIAGANPATGAPEIVPINGSFSPTGGKVTIRGAERYYKIETKDPPGSDGWTQTYRGLRPKPFYIDFWIWTAIQYGYFVNNVLPAVTYSGTKGNVQPLIVQHPKLDALSISAIMIHAIGAIDPVDERAPDMYRCSLTVAEYLRAPPLNTTSTPVGPKAGLTLPGIVPLTASQKRLAIIEALNARAAADGLPAPFGGPTP